MATLDLWPTAEAAEARVRALVDAAVELGPATMAQLVAAADEPAGVRLGALGERLLVDEVAERAGGALEKIARSRGLRRSLRQIFAALRKNGVAPDAFTVAARAVGGAAREVARAYSDYLTRLGSELFDDAEVWRRGCAKIAAGARVRALESVDSVVIHGVVDWDGARLQLVDALLARGLAVRVVLPVSDEAALVRAVAPALAALESRHAHDRLEAARQPLVAPARRPTFVAAATPFVEAREVARRVRDRVDGGAAPESIVVCAESEARRALLAEALSRYGLPVAERRRAPVAAAPPVRLALALLTLADERAEHRLRREALLALAASRYLAPGELPAHRLGRILREAGVLDVEQADEPLAAWVAVRPDSRARDGERVRARLAQLLGILGALPSSATLAQHCSSLRAALEALEVPPRTRGFVGAEGTAAETRALARDQASLRALERVLDDLPRAAARVGMKRTAFSRGRFSRLLEESLSAEPLPLGGVRGAAVELTDLASLAERAPAHLYICGLVDGELPARPLEDPLLGDDERVRLNRVMGRAALPLSSGGEERSQLAFYALLSRCSDNDITITWTRTDEEGAPQLRSALIDALGVRDKEILALARDPLPRVAEARTLDELTARVALEVRGDRNSRLSAPDCEASTELYRLLTARAPARLLRLEQLAAAERLRERFFASDDVPAHPFVGGLRDEALLERLRERLPGQKDKPLSASAVESYAACPFQFFLRSVIRAAPADEIDEELDPLAQGRLHHRALERIFRRLADEGRFPLRGDDAEKRVVAEACDEALAEWRRNNPIGHPALFAVWERRLRRQINALVENERKRSPAEGCTPSRFEARFGPLAVRSGDETIYLHGVIDRIDIGPGRAVVLDYKTGARQGYTAHVKPEALYDSAWQLPIYAAAARDALGPEISVEACFYSLRDLTTTEAVVGDDRALGDGLLRLHRAMRGGEFFVHPRDKACERCGMEAACRVMRTVDDDEVPE